MKQPEILTETIDYWVINKPAGMAVEPPSSQPTLQDWLIEQGIVKTENWDELSRFGVVHRLDTDTSGVLIWAKTPTAQERLKTMWQGRGVEKTYLALVIGESESSGTIELNIERDNKNDRQKVALLPSAKSRPAITTFQQLAVGEWQNKKVSLLAVHPITGRTHQIRVHLKAIGHPIIGDRLYGEKSTDEIAASLDLHRQFLHAWRICLPEDGKKICYEAPVANELQKTLNTLTISLS